MTLCIDCRNNVAFRAGRCRSCYVKKRAKGKKCSNCGIISPNKFYETKGLCGKCYLRSLRYEDANKRLRVVGEQRSKQPEYRIWCKIKNRCYNQKSTGYELYGGRGIKMSETWRKDYRAFLKDMGKRPSPYHSIDRIDVDGNYCKENCRWATYYRQNNNRRGQRGYYWDSRLHLWRVTMVVDGQKIIDARFHNDYGAIVARRLAEKLYGL